MPGQLAGNGGQIALAKVNEPEITLATLKGDGKELL